MSYSDQAEGARLRSWALFALQQTFVPVLSFLITYCSSSILALGQHPGQKLGLEDLAAAYGFTAFCATAFGYSTGRRWFPLVKYGRYIYILPACVLAIGFLIDCRGGLASAVMTYFFVDAGNRDRESGLGLVLITLPTVACCGYSLGITLSECRRIVP